MTGKLLAISDLHVHYEDNKRVVEALRPESDGDWLLLPGDIGEMISDVEWALNLLSERFSTVVWAPGNHELWTHPGDPVQLRGEERYRLLVETCRRYGVVTPEDPYPIWDGEGGPLAIAPLFVLYDYTFRAGHATKEAALEAAYESGVVCTDEFLLHPDPYPSREAWCRARLEITERRLAELPGDLPIILVNHFPLVRRPTEILRYPEFALWCGTEATAAWLRRYHVVATVYGHLHIPRLIVQDGLPHYEVSLGYPREWRPRPSAPGLTTILPQPAAVA
ncbi:3',5'-cyclic AMP phosphodiesterase CpdA [Nonomuraea polychroma]|uniref:3',5'-cyclic AMP phosphodiesterase CpdA n=1 Tax=Nonomuraea polychroma TaxID=46176 RepID=A0A438LZ09_9ACTN|nr:metallophosphoesterase [Nonomuraea polychroma]RVX38769.1 3',5'-cyclic AMP phosphodiesterase CpdA [Nonomuraea polychroma]